MIHVIDELDLHSLQSLQTSDTDTTVILYKFLVQIGFGYDGW